MACLAFQIRCIEVYTRIRETARYGIVYDIDDSVAVKIDVERALARMSPRIRLLLLLRYGFCLPPGECARAMRRSERWVWYALKAAHAELERMPQLVRLRGGVVYRWA